MSRSFDGTAVEADLIDDLCVEALRSPTAGNTGGVRFLTVGHERVSEYFDVATDPEWRARSARFPGLSRAGAVVLAASVPEAYVARYQEPDKANSGLGSLAAWPVPYWHTDAAMATMSLLLLLEDAGLQATLWGNFRHDRDVLAWAGAPSTWSLFGSVIIGHADGRDHRSASLDRDLPSRRDRVLRVL